MDISVVVPLYNEEESLTELMTWIDQVMIVNEFKYEVLFIDDGSSDDSWEIIESLVAKFPDRARGFKFRRNYGKSAALSTGFKATKGKVVITMDADLQDSPEEIPELYRMITEEKYDIVSGWKKKRFDPLTKTIPTKLFNAVTRYISKIKLNDFNCGLKAYRSNVVKAIEVYGDMHRYIPVIAKWAGYTKIGEKVVQHQERKYGKSKFGMERFINGFLDLLSITFIGKFGKRPMHLMGTAGTLFFVIGFFILVYLSASKIWWSQTNIDERPLFYLGILVLIVGTQLFVTGFLAELVVRHSSERDQYGIEKVIG